MDSKNYLSQLTVLYVEDDETTREGLKTFLKRRVGKVYTAADGKEGLQKFKEISPDILIADLLMPKMSGMEMLSIIRKNDRKCSIIITSTISERDMILKAVDIGIVKYAIKPIVLPDLEATLLKIAEELLEKTYEYMEFNLEEKRKYEVDIKNEMATYIKKYAGKGPRDVSVSIVKNSITIISYDTLTIFEQKLMENRNNLSIVEQGRRCFYIESQNDIEKFISRILSINVNLDQIEINSMKKTDKLIFGMEINAHIDKWGLAE